MSERLNQYELIEPFHNKNAGFSRWTFARKGDKEYFLKEFLSPVYPSDDSLSSDLRQQRIKDCEEYSKKRENFYTIINNASRGNTVRIQEFFRCDNHYYIATEKIENEGITLKALKNASFEDRLLICKTIAYEMNSIHKMHIVHADLKASNILIKRTQQGRLIGKIIDFDAGFIESEPPRFEDELGGDQVYMAPEACQFICGDNVRLTCKIDVFALGLLFHQFLTGSLPGFDPDNYDYAFDAVLDGEALLLDSGLEPELKTLLAGMLECNPEKRLSMEEVYTKLEEITCPAEIASDDDITEKTIAIGFDIGVTEKKDDIDLAEKKDEVKIQQESNNWFHVAGDL